jgi:hypothetical protein
MTCSVIRGRAANIMPLCLFWGLWRIEAEGEFLRINAMKCLFLDEAGNFDFSPKGTPCLMVCATLLEINASRSDELSSLRYELNSQGHDIESFHASANTPFVRGAFMRRLTSSGLESQVYAVVLDKSACATPPQDLSQVYVDLFRLVLALSHTASGDCAVYADRVPLQRSRKAIMKAVRQGVGHRSVHFHSSASSLELQIADYCTWAVWRQIVNQDVRPMEALGNPAVHLAVMGEGRPPRLS